MNWLNFFDNKDTKLHHPFGRGINATISADEEELYNKAQEAFTNHDILNGYEYFFKSLQNFTGELANNNIIVSKEEDKLNFEILQGTARITGYITKEHLYAQTPISKNHSTSVAVKRYILERNYQLTYACYFTEGNHIKLKLYHDNITMSPQKIFFPIREIALNADFDKEYLKSEFDNVSLEDISHVEELNEDELRTKYKFTRQWINEFKEQIEVLPSNDNAGMQSFYILNLLFMIDYLIVPKYDIYQKMSIKIQEYFSENFSSLESKNDEIREYIEKLESMSFEEFGKNFYNAKYTFNPTDRTNKEEFDTFISEALLKIRWYKNNRYYQIIPTIYKYISFYILYNYGLHPVLRELVHTLVEIQNPEFFKAMQYPVLYDEENESFSKRAIISRIDEIITPHKKRFKLLETFGDELNFDSLNEFSNSYYLQLQNLNFEEI